MTSLTCREFVDFLMEYLDGGLEPPVRRGCEGHVSECPACETYLATYRETQRLSQRLLCDPEGDVPADVPEDLVAAILAARATVR